MADSKTKARDRKRLRLAIIGGLAVALSLVLTYLGWKQKEVLFRDESPRGQMMRLAASADACALISRYRYQETTRVKDATHGLRLVMERIPVAVNEGGELYEFRFSEAVIEGMEGARANHLRNIFEQYSLFASYNSRGTVTALYARNGTPAWELNPLKPVVLSLQVTRPSIGESEAFEATEPDPSGWSRVRYLNEPGSAWRKRRLYYERGFAGMAVKHAPVTDISFHLAARGLVSLLHFTESELVRVYELTQLRLQEDSKGARCRTTAIADAIVEHELRFIPFFVDVDPEQLVAARREKLKGVELSSLLASLKDFKKQENRETLTDLLTYFPENIPVVLEEIFAHWAEIDYAGLLVEAMAAASGETAQEALIALMESCRANPAMHSLLDKTIRSQQASPRLRERNMAYLWQIYADSSLKPEIRQIALLVTGTGAGKLAEGSEREKYSKQLRQLLTLADNPIRQREAVAALGNMGDDSAFTELKALAHGTDPLLAAHAIESMRFMEGEAIEAELLAQAVQLTSGERRYAALKALRFRRLSEIAAIGLVQLYRRSESGSVEDRLAILRIMGTPENRGLGPVRQFLSDLSTTPQLSPREKTVLKELDVTG